LPSLDRILPARSTCRYHPSCTVLQPLPGTVPVDACSRPVVTSSFTLLWTLLYCPTFFLNYDYLRPRWDYEMSNRLLRLTDYD
jgi:hypothetical protein